jgi:hypothetical protein
VINFLYLIVALKRLIVLKIMQDHELIYSKKGYYWKQ